jgi:SPASM domain peptide maturase of grasp-with-spasm system
MKKEILNSTFFSELYSEKINHFKLYASCISVKGLNRGAIIDLQKGNIHFVPNILLDLLDEFSDKQLFEEYAQQMDILNNFFDYLYEQDLIFFTDNPINFPPISKENYTVPNYLDFLSIEIDNLQSYKIDFFENIDELGVKELVLVQNNFNIHNLKNVLKLCEKSKITGIVIITPYSDSIRDEDLLTMLSDNLRILQWHFYDTATKKELHKKITFSKKALVSILCKRITSVNDFVINTSAYTETLYHNLYFNKRAYIDDNGVIKHSIDDHFTYGNIEKEKFKKVIVSNNFNELWNITKDKIKTCKDCEFRFVCPDNRIPVKISKTEYTQKTVCYYNPKTNLWQDEKA